MNTDLSDWIRGLLIEANNDVAKVYGLYSSYQNKGGNGSQDSFKRLVRKTASSLVEKARHNMAKDSVAKKVGESRLVEELRILKQENKILLSNESGVQKLMEIVSSVVKVYEPFDMPNLRIKPDDESEAQTAILHISDTHLGEMVSPHDTMNLNEYNSIIAKKRLDRYFEKVIDNSKRLKIDNAVILFGGDLISGIIHEEILRNSDTSIVQTILELSDYLSQQIRELTKYFSSIRVFSTMGNHGRMLPGKPYYAEFNDLNFETIILHFIKRELKDVVDEFVIPEGILTLFSIFDKTYCLTHGNIFKGGNGFSLVPNTIPRDSAKLTGFLPKVDGFFIGHFHVPFISQSFVGGIPVYCNGTTMGANAYSLSNFKTITPPSQNFYVVDRWEGVKYYSEVRV
jgi:hypothetical protein